MIHAPVRPGFRVSQKFGNDFNGYYAQWGMKGHDGIDLATPVGTEIYATHDAVAFVGDQGNKCYGKYLKLKSDTRETLYAHLSEVTIKTGDKVKIGQPIGATGNSGGSTGAHLHFSYRKLKDGKTAAKNNGYHGRIDIFGKDPSWLGFLQPTNY